MRNIRVSIACVTFILLMFGMVMVYSASAIYAQETYGDSLFFLKRHIVALMIGFVFTVFAMRVDCDYIKIHSRKILLLAILLLILVLLPDIGKSVAGARRWISFGTFHIQPSEIGKIAILIYLADLIDRKGIRIKNLFWGYVPALLVIGLLTFLVLMEPDLGTAITIGFIGLTLLFISGASIKHLLLTFFSSMPFLYYLILSVPYRRKRLLAFINPWLDERGAGFQIVQSFLALGSGGLLGVGLGQSKQKLFFLPASHTDFIFSIVGEELGFIGAFSVIMLFGVLLWQGSRAAFKTDDVFKKTLIFGIVFTIGFEVIVNMGVSTGLLPTKGLPLPFVSYGGTSLVMHMIAIGSLLNAARERT